MIVKSKAKEIISYYKRNFKIKEIYRVSGVLALKNNLCWL